MASVCMSELRKGLSEVFSRVNYGHERVVVERNGKTVGAIVSVADLNLLDEIERRVDIAEALRALKTGRFTSWEKAREELGL